MTTIIKYIYEVFHFCQTHCQNAKGKCNFTSEFFWKAATAEPLERSFSHKDPFNNYENFRICITNLKISSNPEPVHSLIFFFKQRNVINISRFQSGPYMRGSLSYPCFGKIIKVEAVKREIFEGFYLQSYPGFKKLTTTLFLLQVSDNCSKSISLLTLVK